MTVVAMVDAAEAKSRAMERGRCRGSVHTSLPNSGPSN
jgi:hypothetical protein